MTRPAADGKLDQAGERVRDAASQAAHDGWAGARDLLSLQPLGEFGIPVSIGGVIAAALTVMGALALSAVLRRALRRYGDRHENANKAALYTVSRVLHYLLLLVGVLLALDLAGISLSKFSLFVGALGVGLGFGVQAIFANFISGLLLLFDHSLKVGDFVELDADLRGTVRSINMRSTRLTTNDNIDVMVPNSEFVNRRLVNWTHGSFNRRIRVRFPVAYGVDKELVKKAALEAAARVPFTLANDGERGPQVWLDNFGERAVEFLLVVWLTEEAARRNVAIKAAYLWELDSALKAHGIEVPYPARDLHVRSLFGLRGSEALAALHDAPGAASVEIEAGDADLGPLERVALARNDARADTERQIREDAARAARDVHAREEEDHGGSKP